jgi:uncharacterized membrane protein
MKSRSRLNSIDFLRGLVMVVMALITRAIFSLMAAIRAMDYAFLRPDVHL